MSQIGYIDLVITEDSDLIPFDANKVFYKFDQTLPGYEVDMYEFEFSKMLPKSKELPISDFSKNMFLSACILSGCDYLTQI